METIFKIHIIDATLTNKNLLYGRVIDNSLNSEALMISGCFLPIILPFDLPDETIEKIMFKGNCNFTLNSISKFKFTPSNKFIFVNNQSSNSPMCVEILDDQFDILFLNSNEKIGNISFDTIDKNDIPTTAKKNSLRSIIIPEFFKFQNFYTLMVYQKNNLFPNFTTNPVYFCQVAFKIIQSLSRPERFFITDNMKCIMDLTVLNCPENVETHLKLGTICYSNFARIDKKSLIVNFHDLKIVDKKASKSLPTKSLINTIDNFKDGTYVGDLFDSKASANLEASQADISINELKDHSKFQSNDKFKISNVQIKPIDFSSLDYIDNDVYVACKSCNKAPESGALNSLVIERIRNNTLVEGDFSAGLTCSRKTCKAGEAQYTKKFRLQIFLFQNNVELKATLFQDQLEKLLIASNIKFPNNFDFKMNLVSFIENMSSLERIANVEEPLTKFLNETIFSFLITYQKQSNSSSNDKFVPFTITKIL
ncbi:hypothetical protein BN7_6770 [Wickerhamomyces ciferrii]|uniref:Uncharacterized protein n=1 Tax=Wickerhamomyces ciferrii (strain ATCC 14091 / BCRC 22168 / CBS 111 / JCM 3599 / NBRC 0793 / NRRL Y-1031 F-60-10) TaxID=1206466 RepID=K0KPG9_WICCF|nr:uncharacterized protein BN7_6770 [Wickerhamomyces ciferrii]CCH47155.1 hypothetical protein BN7_6770 [Wickerhamomyces ciferrii]